MNVSIKERWQLAMPRLSAHEMAALMLLRYAPVEAGTEDPDMTALREAGLAELLGRESGRPTIWITRKGSEVLRILGMLVACGNFPERLATADVS
jgi:hypothetical protein